MSKVRLYGSTSGYVELAAPAVAPDSTLTLPALAGGFGKVGQVVQTAKTDTFTTTTVAGATITGLTATITPSSNTANVLIIGSIDLGTSADVFVGLTLERDGTPIGIGDAASNRIRLTAGRYLGTAAMGAAAHTSTTFVYLDSPATTSAITYSVSISANSAATLTVNRNSSDPDNTGTFRTISTITAVEVAA